jgi:hypothetical protein
MTCPDDPFSIDRSHFRIRSIDDDDSELEYWLTQTPERRLQALEFLRENYHGHEYRSQGLERILRITKQE